MAKVAINGMGRIGRAALKIIQDTPELDLIAVNDLMALDNLVYLLRYDTVYGRYDKPVSAGHGVLHVGDREIKFLSEKDPTQLPWQAMNIDFVFECTGVFTSQEGLEKHITAGAKNVILSAPVKGGGDVPMVVHCVNTPEGECRIISSASCTTNCIAPVMEIFDRHIGIKKALMTTIHAYTSSQAIVDGPAKKVRRGRAGAANFVPTSTGAAKATAVALPQLKGKFDGLAVRGPVPVGSLVDIVLLAARATTVEEINRIFKEESEGPRYKGVLGYAEDEIVSSDVIGDSRASIFDPTGTIVVDGDLVKILSWYDNEWGYTNQMIREAVRIAKSCGM
ncbi:MAG: type I glyceraldehyde-3-phosphate dehydrogenase [Deltaproteobacteria bacterium]|nr:type I glyceraldehyde-3-phosphate dehydrogenase [Deltaproteobacteria bacterium]